MIARPSLKLLFDRRQFLDKLLMQLHSGARRRRPAPRIFLKICSPKRRNHWLAVDQLFGVTDPHRRPQQHRDLITLGKLEGLSHHLLRFLRHRGVKRRDFGEQREQSEILLRLRRVQPGIIRHDQNQAAGYADIGRRKPDRPPRLSRPVSSPRRRAYPSTQLPRRSPAPPFR